MQHTELHPIKRRQLLVGVAVVTVLFLQRLPVYGQQPPGSPAQASPSGSAKNTTQNPASGQTSSAKNDPNAEVTVQDSGTTFRLRVNLVQVHVVVRDANNKPVANLKQEDFQLFDQGKLQPISLFTMETRETRREKAEAAALTQATEVGTPKSDSAVLPDRFIALFFDDSHLSLEDSRYARTGVAKFLDSLAPTDRVGLFTSSEQLMVTFTNDKAALQRALEGLVPRPKYIPQFRECPDISHYEADQIINLMNQQVFDVLVEQTIQCRFDGDRNKINDARAVVRMVAPKRLTQGDTENEYVYRSLEDALRRLAGMPGERVMLLVSPGFLLTTLTNEMFDVEDRANQSNIVVNTLDVRGLYAPDVEGDITRANTDTFRTVGFQTTFRVESQTQQAYVLADLAYGTGGAFFHNSNDLAGGLTTLGAAPEASYVLGFSPQTQKMDGAFHTIKVKITGKRKYSIQARRGYYAPKKIDNPTEEARENIQEAVFSRDEIQDMPMELLTQYTKTDASEAKLQVLSKLQMQGIHFRKAGGRNLDNLTVATAIFDANGNFVVGAQNTLEMKLEDATYQKLIQGGLTVKSSFDLRPGKYLVRQVIRDSEGSQMAARNGAVDIPQ
ncbi:MAG TPA: VWA domain-containing protein [Candidatus Acidoferrum sp.]|jgi:VWFA-related protein